MLLWRMSSSKLVATFLTTDPATEICHILEEDDLGDRNCLVCKSMGKGPVANNTLPDQRSSDDDYLSRHGWADF